jgi:hypothetical protein
MELQLSELTASRTEKYGLNTRQCGPSEAQETFSDIDVDCGTDEGNVGEVLEKGTDDD